MGRIALFSKTLRTGRNCQSSHQLFI